MAQPVQPAQESIWEWAARIIAGTYSSPAEAAEKLRLAAKHCRLIGGAAITPFVEGHEVTITVIPIDYADTYPVRQGLKEQQSGAPRRRGIGKSTLMTIANAAGVEWLKTERVDPNDDPHFCVYHVEGRYRALDGEFRPVVGDKDNDLRVGSDQIAGKSEFEVQALRAAMMRSAITKAKLRALREAFGVPHGVLESEVEKPFVFAKSIFTGRSSDPATRRMFAQVIAMKQLAATAAMYGGTMPSMQLPAMVEPAAQLPAHLPDGEVIEMRIEPPTRSQPYVADAPQQVPPDVAPQAPVAHVETAVAPVPDVPPARREAPVLPNKGAGNGTSGWPFKPKRDGDPAQWTPFEKIATDKLEAAMAYWEKMAADPTNVYAKKDADHAQKARAVLDARQGDGSQGQDDAGANG